MADQKKRIVFIERQASGSVSIERVFAEIGKRLPPLGFEASFHKLQYGNSLVGILKNLWHFKRPAGEVLHVTGHIHYLALVLPRDRTILTVHDLVFLHNRKGFRRWVLKKLFLDLPIRKLRYVTAISDTTRDEIVRYLPHEKDKIRVIENPIFEEFRPGTVKPFDEKLPLILQIGTTENKNLTNLIRAATGVPCRLRIIGPLNANIINELNASGLEYSNVEEVPKGGMPDEYRNADIVAFCSTYEGFGLPIIEAQAMHKPVITSDVAPMNKVAGGGAVLVDPHDTESIRAGLEQIIRDAGRRRMLIEIGKDNIRRFDAAEIALRYAALYDEILQN